MKFFWPIIVQQLRSCTLLSSVIYFNISGLFGCFDTRRSSDKERIPRKYWWERCVRMCLRDEVGEWTRLHSLWIEDYNTHRFAWSSVTKQKKQLCGRLKSSPALARRNSTGGVSPVKLSWSPRVELSSTSEEIRIWTRTGKTVWKEATHSVSTFRNDELEWHGVSK